MNVTIYGWSSANGSLSAPASMLLPGAALPALAWLVLAAAPLIGATTRTRRTRPRRWARRAGSRPVRWPSPPPAARADAAQRRAADPDLVDLPPGGWPIVLAL